MPPPPIWEMLCCAVEILDVERNLFDGFNRFHCNFQPHVWLDVDFVDLH